MRQTANKARRLPLVLDGGMSNVLEEMGCALDPFLWTAGLLRSDPDALVAGHLAYLRAGADVITSAGYQASIPGFQRAGCDEAEARQLLLRAVDLAIEARQRFLDEGASSRDGLLVAAGMGPYGALLADGSEYTGVYEADDAALRAFHQPRLELLASSGADLLLFETMPCLRELAIVAELLAGIPLPVWVSFSCRDGCRLRDGERVSTAVSLFRELAEVTALGINCTAPESVVELIGELRNGAAGKEVVIYPNSGEVFQPATKSWLGSSRPEDFRTMAGDWLAQGADIVGGCCRIGPAHIRALRELVDAAAGG